MNIKLSSHGFQFHRNINRRENKGQITFIIITMRKTKEYISDVQQKIIELHKLVKWSYLPRVSIFYINIFIHLPPFSLDINNDFD